MTSFENMFAGFLGKKRSKKQIKRDTLARNRVVGKSAEDAYRVYAFTRGEEVERAPHGRDFIVRKRDPVTDRVVRTKHVEVKSSSTAPLSKLQKKTKKKKSNFEVIRQNDFFRDY